MIFCLPGISLSLGTVTKIFPIILAPVFLLLLWDLVPSSGSSLAKAWGLFLGGFVLVLALVFWPPGILSNWLTLFFTGSNRGGEQFGGFNQWAFLSLPGANVVSTYLTANTSKVILATIAEVILAFVFIVWRTLTATPPPGRERPTYWDGTFLFAVCLSYVAVPLVQPQYLVWVLPWLAVVLVVNKEVSLIAWTVYGVITSFVLLFYLFGLTSPLFYFQPLVFYTHVLSLSGLQASLLYWSSVSPHLVPVFQIPVAVALVVLAWTGLRISGRSGESA